jgi:uncharacterized membrane protein YeaQ/YmgE (transglycosylase-associated protein family)
MSFLWMIIIGSIVGAAFKALMPGRNGAGLIALGIGDSAIAGGLQYGENQPINLVASLVGSIVLIAVYRLSASARKMERAAEQHDFRKAA